MHFRKPLSLVQLRVDDNVVVATTVHGPMQDSSFVLIDSNHTAVTLLHFCSYTDVCRQIPNGVRCTSCKHKCQASIARLEVLLMRRQRPCTFRRQCCMHLERFLFVIQSMPKQHNIYMNTCTPFLHLQASL